MLRPRLCRPLCALLTSAARQAPSPFAAPARRPFVSSATSRAKSLPPQSKPPPDSDVKEFFVKGSGPGGQKINKTSSAVQLKHIPTGIVVKSQATRSRGQNRKHARQLLAQRLDHLLNGDQSRAAVAGHVKKKRADSAAKKKSRKYKKLSEDRASAAGAEHESGREKDEQDSIATPDSQPDRTNKVPKP